MQGLYFAAGTVITLPTYQHFDSVMQERMLPTWCLKAKNAYGEPWITPIKSSRFCIGRNNDCELRLPSESISRLHAEIRLTGAGMLLIKDCNSTNGTFVNFQRLTNEQQLKPEDVIHFADLEFWVDRIESIDEHTDCTITVNPYVEHLDLLIATKAVIPHFQPIINLADNNTIGFELLGRIAYEGVPANIPQLFNIAKRMNRDIELSLLFRDAGIKHIVESKTDDLIFFNTVPNEMNLSGLERSLNNLRRTAPDLDLAMEIHENAVTDIKTIHEIKILLKYFGIKLVYDDFGAGQSRLLELMEAPPDILKFDIGLIRNIHQRPIASLQMLAALVDMTRDLGVRALAEGIEIAEEAVVCRQIGFDLAQGYYFGRPSPNLVKFTGR